MQCIKVKDLKRQLSGTTIAVSSTHVLEELTEVETLYPLGLHCLCLYDIMPCHASFCCSGLHMGIFKRLFGGFGSKKKARLS